MKLALIFFSALTSLSLSFGPQEKPRVTCEKPLPITTFPSPAVTHVFLPLRFGGIRPMPLPYVNGFPAEKPFRLVIKSRDEFSDYWKRLTAPSAGSWIPPLPEIDFSKEMVVVAAMGQRPPGHAIVIDGACEVDGQVEVFVNSLEQTCGGATLGIASYAADAVRLPQTDLPVVFRETPMSCTGWLNLGRRLNKLPG